MADFRGIDPASDVSWAASWSRGQPVARRAGTEAKPAAKLTVQTPVAACRVSLVGSGMYRIDMSFGSHPRAHADFCAWLCEVDEAAAAACRAEPRLLDWSRGKGQSSTLFRGNFRATAFSDTLCFDRDGKLSFDLLDAQSCSCLLELSGCWSSAERWGVRWKVCQVKFDVEPWCAPPPPPQHEEAPPAPVAFGFVDESV